MDTSIKPINVADELSKSFLDYSMSVIISRALPDVRDGLKPSQRRILYAMKELNLSPRSAHRKCAKICGDTSGNYHPHGEQTIYPTLVNMAQPWSMRETLIDGQGNFGSVEGDPPAAMRYTEARLTHLGTAMMDDLDKDTVDFVPNYDETTTEPVVFPSAFPNLLVNGGTGIAVGMATNLAPHNLGEVVEGICAQIDNPHITTEELKGYIKGPDFPTGGEIRGYAGIDNYFRTGKGSIRMRGVVEIEENEAGTKSVLVIREIPYCVNRATLQERIAELVQEKVLTDISGMRDLSDEETRIEIELKREARPQVVVNQLFKLTALETTFSVNMLAIHERRPKMLTVKDAINYYIEHRREVVMRRTRFLLNKAEERAEVLEAYLLALGHMDDFIRIIRGSKNRDEARRLLQAYEFGRATAEGLGILIRGQASLQGDKYIFTERQVNAILELRLYQLTALENDKIAGEYQSLLDQIKDYLDILGSEARVLQIIKDELMAIKEKYATPRLSRIVPDEGEIAIEDLIPNDTVIVTITHSGYIKRTPAIEYRVQARGGKGIKAAVTRNASKKNVPVDFIEHLFVAQNHDYLMFFTNTGRVYVDRVYEIPEGARSTQGRGIKNLLNMQEDERIAALLRIERRLDEEGNDVSFAEDSGNVLFATRDGTVKKTSLYDFRNHRKDGIIAINLEEGNDLISAQLTSGENEVILVTRKGMSIRFEENDLRVQGRNTIGVRGIRPREGDYVVASVIVDPQATLLVASENGLGKRTVFDEYKVQNRGGTGIITMKCTERTGQVVSATVVTDEDELMLMTTAGQSVRIKMSHVRETGRATQGVKLMTLKEGEAIQDIAKVIPDDEEEGEENAELLGEEALLEEVEGEESAISEGVSEE